MLLALGFRGDNPVKPARCQVKLGWGLVDYQSFDRHLMFFIGFGNADEGPRALGDGGLGFG